MRFATPFLICTVVSVFLWQSFDIAVYQDYHAKKTHSSSLNKENQTFLQDVTIIQSPQKEDWLIRYID